RIDPGIRCRDGLAHDDRAGLAKSLDDFRILLRNAIDPPLRAAGRGEPPYVDDVLDADGDSVQRSAILARSQLFVQRPGLFHRPLAVEHDPGVDLRLPLVHLFEAGVKDIDAANFALAQQAVDAGDRLLGPGEESR